MSVGRAAFVLILLVGTTSFAVAQGVEEFSQSGDGFRRTCSAADKEQEQRTQLDLFNIGICSAYIAGIDDGVIVEESWADHHSHSHVGNPLCKADQTHSKMQMMRVLLKFIRDHPERSHEPTAVLYISAIYDAFHCGAK